MSSGPLAIITDSAVSWYFFIAAWGVLYVALSYAAKVGHAERSAAAYSREAQAAQLRALRYQINPHFLFNTLNSLSTLVLRQRTQEAERMIMNLATFFRTSLTSDPAADVPLCDEIQHAAALPRYRAGPVSRAPGGGGRCAQRSWKTRTCPA